jgi:hypothetical protein
MRLSRRRFLRVTHRPLSAPERKIRTTTKQGRACVAPRQPRWLVRPLISTPTRQPRPRSRRAGSRGSSKARWSFANCGKTIQLGNDVMRGDRRDDWEFVLSDGSADQLKCLERAAVCHRKAAAAISPVARSRFQDAAIHWLSLADSYSRSDRSPVVHLTRLERGDVKDTAAAG